VKPVQRAWDSELPFVEFEGGLPELMKSTRENLDRLEEGASAEELKRAVDALRVLYDAYHKTLNREAMLDIAALSITDDPGDSGGYYLSIGASIPKGHLARPWDIHIGQWESDGPEDEEFSSAIGHPVAWCALDAHPDVTDLVRLLDLSAEGEERLTAWATTPIGHPLEGTTFVVTERPNRG
jgi:hypothetical protein